MGATFSNLRAPFAMCERIHSIPRLGRGVLLARRLRRPSCTIHPVREIHGTLCLGRGTPLAWCLHQIMEPVACLYNSTQLAISIIYIAYFVTFIRRDAIGYHNYLYSFLKKIIISKGMYNRVISTVYNSCHIRFLMVWMR